MFVLKSTFEALKKELKKTNELCSKLHDRIWVLENPYKFDLGDMVKIQEETKIGIIIERSHDYEFNGSLFRGKRVKCYTILIGNDKRFYYESALTKTK